MKKSSVICYSRVRSRVATKRSISPETLLARSSLVVIKIAEASSSCSAFFSPLNVDDYVKKSSVICYSREALEKVHEDIELFAKKEGLTAHANSIHVRFE